MRLDCRVDFKDNVRSIEVYIKSLGTSGSSALTPEEEEAILNDFKPKIRYRDVTFEGYYKKDLDGNIVKATDSNDGDKVTLNLIDKIVSIDKDLNEEFAIETKYVKDSELGNFLTSKDEVAEAKCWLFYNALCDAIKNKVISIKAKETNFEDKEIVRESEEF